MLWSRNAHKLSAERVVRIVREAGYTGEIREDTYLEGMLTGMVLVL